jgi:hypothetical protein
MIVNESEGDHIVHWSGQEEDGSQTIFCLHNVVVEVVRHL